MKRVAGRALLVAVVLGGLFLWRGGLGLMPVERELTFKLWGDFGNIRRVDVQLYHADTLLERTQLETPKGATFEPTMKLPLRAGHYRALMMLWREGAASAEVRERAVILDGDTAALAVP